MQIERAELSNFRNIESLSFKPCSGVNVIYGQNAQGKTNILEAIWLFTGSKSFRGARENEMIAFGSKKSCLELDFSAYGRENTAQLKLGEGRGAFLNDVPLNTPSKFAGEFCAVVFSPVHLNIVKDGPEERRKLIDAAICQIKPGYRQLLLKYNRILKQRNASLKFLNGRADFSDILDEWDVQLARYAEKIIKYRQRYVSLLNEGAKEIFYGISSGREKLSLEYISTLGHEDMYETLKTSRNADILRRMTLKGPHRDDMTVCIGERPAAKFGSQGQQRSAVLALKLAEASILREASGEEPVILLDDIMSELDSARQDYILNHTSGRQVFLTCCEMSQVMRLKAGNVYSVDSGKINRDR